MDEREQKELTALGTETRRRLQALERGSSELGDDLVSLVVCRSAARGGYRAGSGDVDLVIVVRQVVARDLLGMLNVMQVARFLGRIDR